MQYDEITYPFTPRNELIGLPFGRTGRGVTPKLMPAFANGSSLHGPSITATAFPVQNILVITLIPLSPKVSFGKTPDE